MAMTRIQEATALPGQRLRLVLTDGRTLERDVRDLLRGELLEPLQRDAAAFADLGVRDGAVVWANGADLCPDVLIWSGTPPEHDLPVVPIAQRTMMQDLWRRNRPDELRTIHEYAAAERRGEVFRERNVHGVDAEEYARRLIEDGRRKGWLEA
jgi:hypothetical protein